MTLLVVFAFLAGAGTALSPCVLPVLPALLSAGATGGRRRPLGIVLGLAVTFTVTIVGLATVVDGVGLGDAFTRDLAIVALLVFGLAVAIPAFGDRLEAPLSRLARFGPKSAGHGFWSGLAGRRGARLRLRAVRGTGARRGRLGRRRVRRDGRGRARLRARVERGPARARAGRPARHAARARAALNRALGGVLVVTAVAMAFQVDIRFQTAIADHLPAALVNPTRSLETSGAVNSRLPQLRPASPYETAARSGLDDYGLAPDFTGNDRWFNSAPLTLEGLRGRVVLIDFWTYTCINCIRTLPHLVAWDKAYRDAGLTIVGVHAPEFAFEKKASNVERAVRQNGIRYPVAQDNAMATWDAWGNQYWPAKYLIDQRGHVRYVHFGEGDYEETEEAIRSLLREPGAMSRPGRTVTAGERATPETYLGAARAEGFTTPPVVGTKRYALERRRRERVQPRRDVDGRRRVGDRGPRRGAARPRAGQGRLPRPVRARDGARDRRRQVREDRARDLAEPLHAALAALDRRARARAALLARRRGLRLHVRVIRRV